MLKLVWKCVDYNIFNQFIVLYHSLRTGGADFERSVKSEDSFAYRAEVTKENSFIKN